MAARLQGAPNDPPLLVFTLLCNHTLTFPGWSVDHHMEEMLHVTSRLGCKRCCDFLPLSCSLALGEARCRVLRTLGKPSGGLKWGETEALSPTASAERGRLTTA